MSTGSIHLILGPMASGKSSELLRLLTRAIIAKKGPVILLRSGMDTRSFVTRDKRDLHPELTELFVSRADDFLDFVNGMPTGVAKVVGIDEGQFFHNLRKGCQRLAELGITVIVSGLNATSEVQPFEEINDLIPVCEEITKLNAICADCGSEEGAFTHLRVSQKTEDIQVGGDEMYEALCRSCFYKKAVYLKYE